MKVPVKIYRFHITLKPRGGSQLSEVRTADAMSYREQDEFLCFDDTNVTVYQVRRELVDEISCDGEPVGQQEVEDPMRSTVNG